MKRYLLLIFSLSFLLCADAFAQDDETQRARTDTPFMKGSGIGQAILSDQQVKDLTLLCQVWGFVKYHHPAVGKGNFNMDAELFRVMPGVLNAQNYKEASLAIEQWVDNLGVPPVCDDCNSYKKKDVVTKPDYGEIFDKSVVSSSLVDKLAYIRENRNLLRNYYLSMHPTGNPNFTNELTYDKMVYPDAGYRLLCLFRYWNMIQYFYPDKHLIGEDWNKVLARFIPQFMEAKDALAYELATLSLICSVHDTHAGMWGKIKALNEERGKFSPPFQAVFVEGKLTVVGYYNDTLGVKDKIKIGDVITDIYEIPVKQQVNKYLSITPGSNYEAQLRNMPHLYLLRSNKADFRFGIIRDGQSLEVTVTGIEQGKLDYGAAPNLRRGQLAYYVMDNNIGYLFPGKYYNKDLPAIKKLFKDTKGLIIDMRCYPAEFMPWTFGPFIKKGDAPFVKFTRGSINDPGLFTEDKPTGIKPTNDYKGKVIVIVNEQTQSQAEYTTMAFQSSTIVKVIGSTTAGADGNVSVINLPGGIQTAISGIGVLYPDGTESQRKGVKIDVHIEPTIEGIKAGKDELLEKARALIIGD